MPPLRERVEDIRELVRLFLTRYNVRFRKQIREISDSALAVLMEQRWPGNIRELENLVERLVAVTDKTRLTEEDLPFEYHLANLDRRPEGRTELLQAVCETFERNFILRALERTEWNVSGTARYLGVPLSTLKHKMGRLGLAISRKIVDQLGGEITVASRVGRGTTFQPKFDRVVTNREVAARAAS